MQSSPNRALEDKDELIATNMNVCFCSGSRPSFVYFIDL